MNLYLPSLHVCKPQPQATIVVKMNFRRNEFVPTKKKFASQIMFELEAYILSELWHIGIG